MIRFTNKLLNMDTGNIFLQTVFFLAAFCSVQLASAQEVNCESVPFEVNRSYPFIHIQQNELDTAKTLSAIHPRYKASWIKEYISVEISAPMNGKRILIKSKNDTITKEQNRLLREADTNSEIEITVHYIPENTLSTNEPKEINFTFRVDPDQEATFRGGQQALLSYLEKEVIRHIPPSSFTGYDLTAVKFTINKTGEVVNAHLFGLEYRQERDEHIDSMLLQTIQDMPCWKPAIYNDNTKVDQEFVLTVGNMQNCIIPMLNVSNGEF